MQVYVAHQYCVTVYVDLRPYRLILRNLYRDPDQQDVPSDVTPIDELLQDAFLVRVVPEKENRKIVMKNCNWVKKKPTINFNL